MRAWRGEATLAISANVPPTMLREVVRAFPISNAAYIDALGSLLAALG